MNEPGGSRAGGGGSSIDDRRLAALAGELGLTAAELEAARSVISPGLDTIVMGGLIRFEDALLEMSR